MRHIVLTICMLLGLLYSTSLAGGPWYYETPTYHHASTAQEGALSGWARWWQGFGDYLDSVGNYLVESEIAKKQHIENEDLRIHTKWKIQDEYKERNKSENYLDRWERSLDTAERRHALKQREEELRNKGVLPPKQEPHMVIRGRTYKNCEEWKQTADYSLHRLELEEKRLLRKIDEIIKQREYRESLAYQNWWDDLGWSGQQRYIQQKKTAKLMGTTSPRAPINEFQDIETKLKAYFDALDRVRVKKEFAKQFIAIRGNKSAEELIEHWNERTAE